DARKAAVQRYLTDLPAFLRKKDIRYAARHADGDTAVLEFADADKLEKARAAIAGDYKELELSTPPGATPTLRARMSDTE
ncbi:hypothetical protein, partial [Pasteurella multocida]|uniref:hypothetical protein n=1 Tax=Pasteurella multocida TaxID=747 RepID=UPI0035E427F9